MKAKLLIVDDDADVREGITTALVEEGYRVIVAVHGADALDVLLALPEGEAPDAILLDMTMPVMDGYTFRDRQLADARIASIPVICCSADGRATLPGPSTWPLRKPFDLDHLFAAVDRATAERETRDRATKEK